ncbi:MAG: hypothetical protein RIR26_1496 [Pseudomonadota bacterium]
MSKLKAFAPLIFLLVTIVFSACDFPPVQTFVVRPQPPSAPGNGSQGADGRESHSSNEEDDDSSQTHWIQIDSGTDTLFKAQNADSSSLSRDEKCLLPRGTRHTLASAPEWLSNSHVKVTLHRPMSGCSFKTGYVYTPHIGATSDEPTTSSGGGASSYSTEATLYTTENTDMEGGSKDRCGRPLNTLDDYMNWKAEEVSVAMDTSALPYGTVIRIPEIERRLKVKDPIPFRVVDTGGAFANKGTSRMDICVGHSQNDVYSSKYVWMSHAKFEFQVVSWGKSYSCQ